jgi:uncharacterized membrane protein YeaQ/YmgE (transglycosylase-associated protein family)
MTRRHLVALLAGIIAVPLVQGAVTGGAHLIERCCIADNRSAVWVGVAMTSLYSIGMLVPGFVAGFIAKTRGILFGFLAGLLGGIAHSLARSVFPDATTLLEVLSSPSFLISIVGTGLTLCIPCAAGGATAELLRSNKSLERTREG